METISLISPGKINLYLEIIGDRNDGFHELVMILQSIDLADIIDIKINDTKNITIDCQHPQVPLDESNLAYKAAKLMCDRFKEHYDNYGGFDIRIKKNIPVAAGLAGGSSNAGAVLVGIDLIWKLGLTKPELEAIADRLGSDVPFCLSGGTAIATGRGEKLAKIGDLENLWVVLGKYKDLSVSTPWAYKTYREKYRDRYVSEPQKVRDRSDRVHSGSLVKAILQQDRSEIGKLLYNDLEKVVLPKYPQVDNLRNAFNNCGVLGAMMSGSGPTVFALCESKSQAENVVTEIESKMSDSNLGLWVTSLSKGGIQVRSNKFNP